MKLTDRQATERDRYDPLADAEPFDKTQRPSTRLKLAALVVAAVLAAMSVLAASYSLFKGRPSPEMTRPLPRHVPTQGAIR